MEIPWQIMLASHNFCHPYLEFLWCLQLWPKECPQRMVDQALPSICLENGFPLAISGIPLSLSSISPGSPLRHPPPQKSTSLHLEEEEGNFYMAGQGLRRKSARPYRASAILSWKFSGAWNSMSSWFKRPWSRPALSTQQ